MGITVEEGEAFGAKFLEAFKSGFPENNHEEKMKGLFAEKTSWDWSDGFKGEGSADAIFEQFKKTWGAMVSCMCFQPDVLVDTTNSKVVMFDKLVINIDGGFPEANLVHNKLCFVLTLNEDKKVTNWTGIWDNEYAPMLEALGKVSAKMAAAKAM